MEKELLFEEALFTLALFLPILIVVLGLIVSMRVRRGWLVVVGALVVSYPLGQWLMAYVNGLGLPPGEEPKCGMQMLLAGFMWIVSVAVAVVGSLVIAGVRSQLSRRPRPDPS